MRKILFNLINKIYKTKNFKNTDLKDEFRKCYIEYANKLYDRGFKNESTYIMNICGKYALLMGNGDVLVENKQFFNDFFERIDHLICIKKQS